VYRTAWAEAESDDPSRRELAVQLVHGMLAQRSDKVASAEVVEIPILIGV
jgi:hypothetical protein